MKNDDDKMDELKANEWETWTIVGWMKNVNKWNENHRGHMDENNRNDWLKVDKWTLDERLWTSLDE